MALNLQQTQNSDKYFVGDCVALQNYQREAAMSKKYSSLDLQLYPEPFAGNPDAPVYILNGNPGLDARDRSMMQYPNWSNMMVQSYNPTKGSTMYWLDEQWESKIFSQALNSPGTYRSGFRWWLGNKGKTPANLKWKSGIASSLKNRCPDLHKKVFNVEYFPYHSKSLNMNLINGYINDRKDDHISVVSIVNNYLKNALNTGKVFIIMRCEKEWIERLNLLISPPYKISFRQITIKNKCRYLYDYGGKEIITLNCRQRVWLTQGNILEDPCNPHARWNLLCQTLGITPP